MREIKSKDLDRFASYLKNREQCIRINQYTNANKQSIKYEVLQGSILRLLLLLLYINDLTSCSTFSVACNICDDENLFL